MWRKWFRRGAIAVAALFVLLLIVLNLMGEPMAEKDAPGLARRAIDTANGYTVSYLSAGSEDQPRIIYIHGTPGSATTLQSYLVNLVPGFEAISPDRPGFGLTRPPKPLMGLEEQAKALEPFLVERDGKWPILVGHSLGAPIICRAAADFPGKVRALVILSGSLDPDLETVFWVQHIADFAFVPYLLPKWLRNSNKEVLPLRRDLEELKPLLSEIACPIIILHAPDDVLVPYGNVAYMKAQFPKDTVIDVITLEGKNHFVPWNAEADVREAIARIAGAS